MLDNFKPDKMSVEELAALPVEALASAYDQAAAMKDAAQAFADRLGAAMERRYGDAANFGYIEKGDDTGTVVVETANGYAVRCTRPKRVEWDQKALHSALDAMPLETARHYASAKFSVSETKFSAAPPDIRDKLLPARSVKPGKSVWKIEAVS